MSIYSIPPLVGAVFAALIGIYVLLKNRNSQMHISFALYCSSIFTWLFGYTLAYSTKNEAFAVALCRVACTGVVFTAPTFYHFTVSYLKKNSEIYLVVIAYAAMIAIAPFFITSNIFLGGTYYYYWGYYSKAGRYHPLYLIIFFIIFLRSFFLLYSMYSKRSAMSPIGSNQIKYIFLAYVISLMGAIDYLPKYGIEFYPFGFTFEIAFTIIVAYAIVKYHLMDIRLAITRAGIFVVIYALVLGLPFLVGSHTQTWVLPTAIAVVLATLGPIIYSYLQRKADSVLLAEQRRYQHILLQASKGMVREHKLERLMQLTVRIVKKTVKIDFSAIFLFDDEKRAYEMKAFRNSHKMPDAGVSLPETHPLIEYIHKHNDPSNYEELPKEIKESLSFFPGVSLIIPSLIENNLLGIMFLGEKLNKAHYTQDDINVFKIMSQQAALATANCKFIIESEKNQERIFNAEKLASIGGMAEGITHQMGNRLNHFSCAAGEQLNEMDFVLTKHEKILSENPDLKESINYIIKTAQSINDNVKRTHSMIRGILDFAKVDNKSNMFSHFQLSEVAGNTLTLLCVKHHLPEFPLVIDTTCSTIIYGVKVQITESLFNIFDNCYEAIDEKRHGLTIPEQKAFKPMIKLSASQKDGYTIIDIEDNGIGIKDENKHKIFAPFFTTKPSVKSGTGIGMYVVRRMIEEYHKGKIRLDSIYGTGTKIQITLPYKSISAAQDAQQQPPANATQ